MGSKTKQHTRARVIVGDQVEAVLNVERVEVNGFSGEDIKLLETLLQHVATAMRRIQSQQRLEELHEQHSRELVDGVQRASSTARHDLRGPLQTIMNAAYVARAREPRSRYPFPKHRKQNSPQTKGITTSPTKISFKRSRNP